MAIDWNIFKPYIYYLLKDERITAWHLAVILAIIQLAVVSDADSVIYISRRKVMRLAHINSIVTYHKCIRELQRFGFIHYEPSYHPGYGSQVYLLKKWSMKLSE